ncbi:MAG: carboxypeptidase regulatory-like domain-containing protein [Candidatus Cloacimonadaceae bacterium]|nr:carboxypeptidase regulatory-like domain-containing protein [Candidatus Cloacimonadaceae bacterium]MDP3114509.1 carboxypeptidase regulatory-like domain-containing protein [Candidatus Cloacimonadaceae bacterium]
MKKLAYFAVLFIVAAFLFTSCEKTTKPEDTPNVVKETTIILSDAVSGQCQDGGWGVIILPSVPVTQALIIGNIIVSKPTTQFPNGFLRRVTQVNVNQQNVSVTTVSAALTQALQSGYVGFNHVLNPSKLKSTQAAIPGVKLTEGARGNFQFEIDTVLYDADGNAGTTNDQVVFSGTADLDITLKGYIQIQNNQLKQMRFTADQTFQVNAAVSNSVSFFNVNQEVTIFSQSFQPFIVFFGVFPVVLTPVLDVKINLAGNATATLNIGYQYTNSCSAGMLYKNQQWTPVQAITESATSNITDPLAFNVSYKASLKPEMSVMLYGIVGPSISVGAFGEMIVNPAVQNWWQLWAGFFGQAGINITVIDNLFTRLGPWELFNTRFLVKQAANPIQGYLVGQVKDAILNQGLEGVSVKVYLNNTLKANGTTNSSGEFSILVNSGSDYRVLFEKTGYHSVNYYNVTIQGSQNTVLQTIMQIDASYTGTGVVNGYVYNALNGNIVPAVTLKFRAGMNTQSGSVIQTTETGSDGAYTISTLTTGHYTVEANKAEFVTTFFSIYCIGGQTLNGQNGVITPILDASEIRVVLTWGSSPSDLDSHLTGPNPAGGRFHVYYGDDDFYYGDIVYASLDYDDTSSFGPETITIYNQTGGLYRYSVHDYSNRYSTTSYALSNSNATVRVYFGSNLVQTFYVPSNTIGTLWTVFELYDNQIIPKNMMTNESSPSGVTKGMVTDGDLLLNLPQKD